MILMYDKFVLALSVDSVHAYTKGRYILIFVSTDLNVYAHSQV